MIIEAMKQALEALNYLQGLVDTERGPKAAAALRQSIEQAEKQEPVAWMVYTPDGKSVCVTDNPSDFTEQHRALPLYTTPQPQRELNCVCGAVWEGDEMVCVPHKRAWVGLTDEEMREVYGKDLKYKDGDYARYARAIEAKLKEKNNG